MPQQQRENYPNVVSHNADHSRHVLAGEFPFTRDTLYIQLILLSAQRLCYRITSLKVVITTFLILVFTVNVIKDFKESVVV
jgi:hypothetical protein